jgi:sugar lactone lactonase YvrE
MKKLLKWIGISLLSFLIILSIILYSRYGGGVTYNYEPSEAMLSSSQLEVYFQYDEPIGNVAASQDSNARVFFTIHPESRPQEYKLCEIVDGAAVPYPDEEAQQDLITPLGVFVDRQERLWVIDHGNHAFQGARLLAYNLTTNQKIVEYTFTEDIAEKGSFFNDLSITPDGKYAFVADVSFFGKQPSLIVYDIENSRAQSLLDGHPSVTNQGYVPVTPTKKMRFIGGLVDLMPGIDGLDVDPTGEFVYYAAMSHETLYRIPVVKCILFDGADVGQYVEALSAKPLSDGIRVGPDGGVYITDIEHQGIALFKDGQLSTLIRDSRIQWADGLSFGGDGFCYLADSDIPNQMLQSKVHIASNKPYTIFRFSYD